MKVVVAAPDGPSISYTDGKAIYILPPPVMGDVIEHQRSLCDYRDADEIQLCPACRVSDAVLNYLYHEIGHVAFGTFKVAGSYGKMVDAARYLGTPYGDVLARRLEGLREEAKDDPHLVGMMISPYMPMLVNAIEDIRVDARTGERHAGVPAMKRASLRSFMHNGIEKHDGTVRFWTDLPLNAQAILAFLIMGEGMQEKGIFDERIESVVWGDEKLYNLSKQGATFGSVRQSYALAVAVLARLIELGLCQSERDPDVPPPPPEGEGDEGKPGEESDDDKSEEGSGDSNQEPQDESDGEESAAGDSEASESDADEADADEASDPEGGEPDEAEEASPSSGDEPGGDSDSGDAPTDSDVAEEGDADGPATPGEGGSAPGVGQPDQAPSAPTMEADTDGDEPDAAEADARDLGPGDTWEGWGHYELGEPSPEELGKAEDAKQALEAVTHPEADGSAGWGGDAAHEDDPAVEEMRDTMERLEHFDSYSHEVRGVKKYTYAESKGAWRSGERSPYRADFRDLQPSLAELSRPLSLMRRAFSENNAVRSTGSLKAGRVNARQLGKRAWGNDERMFKKKERPNAKSYFVCIGLDVSGSTAGSTIEQIKRAAFAQAELCARMGIEFAVYAHTGAHEGWGVQDVAIFPVKEANEKWNDEARTRLAHLAPFSTNLDGHTMEFYRKVCDKRDETNRIIMYYTDGAMPASNYDDELQVLQRELKESSRRGYTVLGVGIGTDSPREHGLPTVEVNGLSDIAAVVRHLEDALIMR